jgi:Cu(I)/Ag(I) efflux system protein CusF
MLRRRASLVVLLACLGAGAAIAPLFASAPAQAAEHWDARGVIERFGPERKSVSIAHEAIPGYMGAMTMSFEPRDSDQLARFAIGDRVSFTFTDTDDGRRVIESIAKR